MEYFPASNVESNLESFLESKLASIGEPRPSPELRQDGIFSIPSDRVWEFVHWTNMA
jgi:hypothetical protein